MTAAARPPARPETSLRQQVRTLFLVTLALAIAAMSLSVYSLVRLLDRRHTLVSVVQPAALDTGRLLTALVDEETGIRGFLLTTSPDFLEPYRTGQADEGVALAGIDRAARRRPAVAASAAAVRASVQAWHDQYADPTVAATQAGDTTGRSPASLDQGRVLFDQIRLDVAQLLADLDHQRAAAQEALDHATVVLAVSVGLLSVVTMVGGALVWRLYRRSIETPLLAVAADAAMVSAGQLDTPIVPTGPAELVAMAASMETMRARIVAELAEANQARAEVEEQRAALERSNRDLEQFAYVASHDLQEPLRKVASFTQLLQSRYHDQLDERADQYIDYAVDGAKRMQVLINDLLAFSRVTRQTDHAGPVDSGAACAAAIDHLATLIEESGAEVNAGPLPVVVGNAGLLVALFQNLVGNAVKFRSPDRPPVVSVDAEPDGDRWRFTVADNGVGIEPEYAERVFEIFKRLHTRDAYPGTGIGLALCRKIVDALGGEIWVDTAATEGARIRFTLRRPEEHPA